MSLKHTEAAPVISESEAIALQQRFGWDPKIAGSEATSVRDVAEATGVSPDEVTAFLDRIRTEQAFFAPPKRRISHLWVLGTIGLVLGVAAFKVRFDALAAREISVYTPYVAPGNNPVFSPSPVREDKIVNVSGEGISPEFSSVPGINVVTAGNTRLFMSSQLGGDAATVRVNYAEAISGLTVTLTEALKMAVGDKLQNQPIGAFRDYEGNTIQPKPGQVYYNLNGWNGQTNGYLAIPRKDGVVDWAALKGLAKGIVIQALQRPHEKFLSGFHGKTEGVVLPPPGVSVLFAGRRFDLQRGPRLRFVPVTAQQVESRLREAILDAMDRDRKPPSGRWSGQAELDKKAPVPAMSRVSIDGPTTTISFEVPTAVSVRYPTPAAVRAAADQVIREHTSEIAREIAAQKPTKVIR